MKRIIDTLKAIQAFFTPIAVPLGIATFVLTIAGIIYVVKFYHHPHGDPLELAIHPKHEQHWPFDGLMGHFDKQSIKRGYQVYREICASCHSMELLAYRNLGELGFGEAEIKGIAAEYTVMDGPDDVGDMFERPAIASDRFVSPYPNEQAARAANGSAYPPDLSLIIKARHDGANYVYSLLTGYDVPAPEGVDVPPGQYYNPYFEGRKLAMAAPIAGDGQVDYPDGTEATVAQMSVDVVNFLQWAAEPEMEQRKKLGLMVMIYLLFFTVIFYLAKKRIWSRVK